jgi:hypothetical protein
MFKELIISFLAMVIIIGMWCVYVVSLNQGTKTRTLLQPLDVSISYCESCKKCTSHQSIEDLEFEALNDSQEAISL